MTFKIINMSKIQVKSCGILPELFLDKCPIIYGIQFCILPVSLYDMIGSRQEEKRKERRKSKDRRRR